MANNQDDIVVNGVTYDAEEVYKRRLYVTGVQPTDYEQYTFLNVMVQHKNRVNDAGGNAQVIYRYDDLADLNKFHAHQYPYYIDVTMTTVTDKKSQIIPLILHADFVNVEEMEIVPRKPVQAKPVAPAAPKA